MSMRLALELFDVNGLVCVKIDRLRHDLMY